MELVHADRWIYSKLNGDAPLKALVTGGIHGFPAPIGASYPLVLYQDVTSTDIRGNGPSGSALGGSGSSGPPSRQGRSAGISSLLQRGSISCFKGREAARSGLVFVSARSA